MNHRIRGAGPAVATLLLAVTLSGCSALAGIEAADDAKAPALASGPDGSARAALIRLAVRAPAPMAGYDREAGFGPAWSDDTSAPGSGNHCDTRNDVLRRDLHELTFKGTSTCVVATGTLKDPYTGRQLRFVRGPQSARVQIDHAVALGASWRAGARQLTQPQREALSNDPLNLLAVDGPSNASKSDRDADTWLPPDRAFHCRYVARQIAVKTKYQLSVTAPERNAMSQVLATCPDEPLPAATTQGVALPNLP
ncbi:HNH endonuclease family protein [Streptomyces sp. NBC_01264]|uniref:HNH endonuclease family protein n=1 Tax=Streptomyces sp. NBC_01264 TaxID=2903804 RepID=UPI00224DDDDB|nr:HNH endonuclease family protein [Streptomyces sp. NBC_01264]MCX4784067.1 HNH endonuclease family protein [Streptomyces sp. NBC_01264]